MTELERRVGGERLAPRPLLAHLREIEPKAELVYVGEGEWWLGRYAPTQALAQVGKRKVQSVTIQTQGVQLTPDAIRRWRVGRLQQEGFQYAHAYYGEPDGRIVRDLEVADYIHRLPLGEQERLATETEDEGKEDARRDLADDGRARDAYRYWRTRQHSITRERAARGRSGWTTQQVMT